MHIISLSKNQIPKICLLTHSDRCRLKQLDYNNHAVFFGEITHIHVKGFYLYFTKQNFAIRIYHLSSVPQLSLLVSSENSYK